MSMQTSQNALMAGLGGYLGGLAAGGAVMKYQLFTSSGTFEPSQALLDKGGLVLVTLCGGGGAGAGRRTLQGSTGGGGSGYWREAVMVRATENVPVTVGAGGQPGTTENSSGGSGGASAFGVLQVGGGGGGGTQNNNNGGNGGHGGTGGGGGSSNNVAGRGGNSPTQFSRTDTNQGTGGAASVPISETLPFAHGGPSLYSNVTAPAHGGEKRATGGCGGGGSNGLAAGGGGGSTPWGDGGVFNAAQALLNATGFGAGGAGSFGAAIQGGAGAPGFVLVVWWE